MSKFRTYKAWYRAKAGEAPRQLVTVIGIASKSGRILVLCETEAGADHWGYVNQFDEYREEDQSRDAHSAQHADNAV